MEGWDGGYAMSRNASESSGSSAEAAAPASRKSVDVVQIPENPITLSTRSYYQEKTDEEIRLELGRDNPEPKPKGWWARLTTLASHTNSLSDDDIAAYRKEKAYTIRMYAMRQDDGFYTLMTEWVHDRTTATENFILERESGLTLLDAINHLRQFEQHDDFKSPFNFHPYHHISIKKPVADAPNGTWWKDYVAQHNITLTEDAKPVPRNAQGFISEPGVYVVPKAEPEMTPIISLPVKSESNSPKTDPYDLQCGDAVDVNGVKIENYDPAKDLDRCGGIYLGAMERTNGITGLKEIWDLYAAPQDLKNSDGTNLLLIFNNAVKYVAALTNYHGRKGCHFANENELNAAFDNATYNGGWFIPTREILHGETISDRKIQLANFNDSRDMGAFKGTFVTSGSSSYANWYWSLTTPAPHVDLACAFDFRNKSGVWFIDKNEYTMSTRLVRAELRSSAPRPSYGGVSWPPAN